MLVKLEKDWRVIMDLKEKFKKWWMNDNSLQKNEDKYAETTKKGYFRALEKLNENKQIDVFIIENIKELKIILARLKTGDLRSYNQRNQNVDTSAGLEQYIKFMEYRENKDRDKEKLKEIIKKFVARSLEGINLKYRDIIPDSEYNGFRLRPSFGQTNFANITWIGFMKYGQKPQNGIYPSICFHRLKNPKYITVEKAVSNKNPPSKMWDWKENDNPDYSENKARTRVKYDINTIDDLSDEILEGIMQNLEDVMQDFEELFTAEEPIKEKEVVCKIRNIILYGVPGVGKTYSHKMLIDLIESKTYSDNEIFTQLRNHKNTENFKKANEEKRVKFITFHQSFGYEDFIEGFRPNENGEIKLQSGVFKSFCDEARENKEKNYYLVIDEINRGNISKIFGELITLIEEDKRDSLHVTLPYSSNEDNKETFSVPSNLYIIGTMNSTDKSIALIDVALRRRFTFLKLLPNPKLVKYEKARQLMQNLNDKITEILDEEHLMGHSYFMCIKNGEDLKFVKEYKLKPLLEEYFYGDKDGFTSMLEVLNNKN